MKKRIIIFSGAGISQPSGISTFRDSNGLWNNHKIEEICTLDTWESNFNKVHTFYNQRRTKLGNVEPNIAHKTIAKWQEDFGADKVINITQNIDDLFERAGVVDTVHIHGNLKRLICTCCGTEWDIGYEAFDYNNTKCPNQKCHTHNEFKPLPENMVECKSCGKKFDKHNLALEDIHCVNKKCVSNKKIKPSVIFFGEYPPEYHTSKRILNNITSDDILLIIGTMGNVYPISMYIDFIKYSNRENPLLLLNNMEKSDYLSERYFEKEHIFYESCETAILKIDEIIRKQLS